MNAQQKNCPSVKKNTVDWNLFLIDSILYFFKSTAKQDYFIKCRGVKKQYC